MTSRPILALERMNMAVGILNVIVHRVMSFVRDSDAKRLATD